MNIILSLDYEVFFGSNTGTVAKTLIEPTDALLKAVEKFGIKLVFFVDAGFLSKLREQSDRYPQLGRDLDTVRRQLESLQRAGHDIQLHIHPHWEDSHWNGDAWVINTDRYALHNFSEKDATDIVGRYKSELIQSSGNENIFAYRAGGWVIQPFSKIRNALKSHDIYVDSTVFKGGTSDSVQVFDFQNAPDLSTWRFEDDPLKLDEGGYFLEVPIAAFDVSPLFFWKFAAVKKMAGARHRSFGNGKAIALGKGDLMKKLLRKSTSVVSMDGFKASFLKNAYQEYVRQRKDHFVVIGHPKALTRYSIDKLGAFCGQTTGKENYITYRAFAR